MQLDDWSWTKRIKSFANELEVGQEIDCVIVENNPESKRIRVSVKDLEENPWVEFAKTYKSGSIVEAEITSIMDFGIFVKAPLGIEGLINKSNLSDSREESFEEAVKNTRLAILFLSMSLM